MTYVEAEGSPNTTYPAISRTTTSLFPISDEIDQPLLAGFGAPGTNLAIASAGLFEVSDQTGYGMANAEAVSQIWFSPLVGRTQTLNIQIYAEGDGNISWTAGQISLLDLTANSELWNYSWNGIGSPPVPVGVPPGNNVPWNLQYPTEANFNSDTDFLASDQYELTMIACFNAANDFPTAQIQLTGLQVVPEPSTVLLLALCGNTLVVLRQRKCQHQEITQT